MLGLLSVHEGRARTLDLSKLLGNRKVCAVVNELFQGGCCSRELQGDLWRKLCHKHGARSGWEEARDLGGTRASEQK